MTTGTPPADWREATTMIDPHEYRHAPRVTLERHEALADYTNALAHARNAWRAAYSYADQTSGEAVEHRDIAMEADRHAEHQRNRYNRIVRLR
jgi:hypothetical protein